MITFADLDYLNAPFTVLTNGTEQPETPTNPGNTSSTNVISDSVGQGGDNARQNVRVIQALLNNISNCVGGPSPKLVIDGWYGENTLNAIKKFQDYHSITSNYGLIRPNGNSLQRLVNAQPAASLTLTGNVGENESNIFTDVRSLQSALNAVSSQAGGPAQKLVTDGLFGQRTLAAIKKFQDTYYTGNDPYGLVTPDGRTLAILNTFV
jgi:peptidoglycan hydrolase-like protein with peptidoglycan-binding domain